MCYPNLCLRSRVFSQRTPMTNNEKTSVAHWDSTWHGPSPFRHRTSLNVSIADRRRMLAKEVAPGMRYLEIGCAPGLMLAYVARTLGAEVYGLDYSPVGIAQTRAVFDKLALKAILRCEDVFSHTFPKDYFDVVHSGGVIEHFEDPREIVRIHVELLKPGGVALISIPHFSGLYGTIAAKTDPGNLAIHNRRIMNPASLQELAPQNMCDSVSARPFGRISLSSVSFNSSRLLGLLAKGAANTLGLLQPLTIERLCPSLLLRIVRRPVFPRPASSVRVQIQNRTS